MKKKDGFNFFISITLTRKHGFTRHVKDPGATKNTPSHVPATQRGGVHTSCTDACSESVEFHFSNATSDKSSKH